MLKFYEYFDAESYQNGNRMIQEPTVIEDPQFRDKHSNLGSNPTMTGEPLLLPVSGEDKGDIPKQ